MLIVCGKGKKGGGKRETKRQAVREKRGKLHEGRKTNEKRGTEKDEELIDPVKKALKTSLPPVLL
jgi:hypothetical protein